ncbi:hypothetical protein [Bifidobacterium myosotis]|uniref:Uncharacterized protein n=1 Tax=Bifidobacterium myosotis TaxID=1630166 RepID=A0A5M9ZL27_9BIFI|nr:hypothetical protein [Bifidobacterium myosotis]KAA8828139.1 hypothetical protein EMO91_06775 [Bifidobacterium myosotis]
MAVGECGRKDTGVATPEIRCVGGQWVLYADDRPLIWRVEERLPYDRAHVLRVLRMREMVEFRSGPFDCWRLRLEFPGTRIHWTRFDHWGRRIQWTVDTDYDATVRVLGCFLEHGDPLVEAGRIIERALGETDDARRLMLLDKATCLIEQAKGGNHGLG